MMFRLTNSKSRYGIVAVLFHWLMVLLIIYLLGFGIYMVDLPVSILKLELYGQHKEYGLLALGLVILRYGWRLLNTIPPLPAEIPAWQKLAGHLMHFGLYVLMFAMPITGWMLTSAAGFPASFFGWFVLPSLLSPDKHTMVVLILIHQWLGYAFIAAILMHMSAALKHHFVNKDDVFRRMLP